VRHRSWHLLWDYGNGDIGNQGVPELDIMRWALGLDTHPTKIASMGGTYIHKDDQEAPQVHAVMYEYAGRDVLLTFETRSGLTNTEAGMGAEYPFLDKRKVVGVIFIGAEGLDHPGLQQLLHLPGAEANPRAQGGGRGRHRRPAALANIAYRTGRMLRFDPQKERFIGDEEANRLLTRNYRAPFVVPEKV